jgi:hypothetical protein
MIRRKKATVAQSQNAYASFASAVSAMVPASTYAHCLTHNRNQGPLGDCHTKFQREGEQQQYGQASLPAIAWTIISPIGNRPISRPWTNNAKPRTTQINPPKTPPRSGTGWRRTTILKKHSHPNNRHKI